MPYQIKKECDLPLFIPCPTSSVSANILSLESFIRRGSAVVAAVSMEEDGLL